MKKLHISVFLNHKKRHGGVKRSEQLEEYLRSEELISINPYFYKKNILSVLLSANFLYVALLGFYWFIFKGISLKAWIKLTLVMPWIVKNISDRNVDEIFIETAPGVSILVMNYLKIHGYKYNVFPHNIEFLVPGQIDNSFRGGKYAFDFEIGGYLGASKVFAINDFDAAILKCKGVDCLTLPYFPPRYDMKWIFNVNKKRMKKNSFDYFLLIGTVTNKPTLDGLLKILEDFSSSSFKEGIKIKVAGFGTEVFKKFESNNLQILGEISDEERDNLFITAKALLINQPQTTGFLTRIVEANLAGVPQIILGDYFQARNLDEYGIFSGDLSILENFESIKNFKKFI